ncbi:MAG TPA: HlyC/CorC family transporter, partial [Clostridiales bacterium]|nr:HlyC/CorC family transporter [Clostridiales bacterium]
LICLLSAAYFSASEIAYNSANKLRLKKAADEGQKTAKLAYKITEKFPTVLAAILIGNNFANITGSAISTVIIMGMVGKENASLSALIATLAMTVFILVFGEIIPKILAHQNADTLVRWIAYPTAVLVILLTPVVIPIMLLIKLLSRLWTNTQEESPTVTEEELSTIIDTIEEEGIIDEEQSDLLQSTLDFQNTTAQEVLTPRIHMVTIDIDDDKDETEAIIRSSRFSRIPVYEDSIDNIIGILNINHYYKERLTSDDVNIRSLLMEPYFIHKTMKIPAILAHMKDRQVHMAIVVDEYGGTMGLITMEDILEQLVGDIWDDSDEIVSDYTQTGENTYDISGDMNVYDFFELVDVSDKDFDSEYTTIGGWAIEMLESNPREGDSFKYKNLYIIVSEMEDMRVMKVSVRVNPIEDEDEE